MASGETRRELADSVRFLVREELWLFAGLLGGSVGYVIWVAGTGAAVEEFVRVLADVLPLDRGSTELWVFALLWVVVPSVVAVRYVVDHLTNLRGNVEKCYRVDQPLVLLGPPAVLVSAASVYGAVRGTVDATVLLAVGAANVVLLVRTAAYGYRVYSLSVPRLLQALLFVAAVATSIGLVGRIAPITGKAALVDGVVAQYGLDGTISAGASSVPLLAFVGATAPGVVALSYVWVQIFASLIVRIRTIRLANICTQTYERATTPGAVAPTNASSGTELAPALIVPSRPYWATTPSTSAALPVIGAMRPTRPILVATAATNSRAWRSRGTDSEYTR
jgi:hypothetical protein